MGQRGLKRKPRDVVTDPGLKCQRGILTMLSNYIAIGLPDLAFQLRRMYEI